MEGCLPYCSVVVGHLKHFGDEMEIHAGRCYLEKVSVEKFHWDLSIDLAGRTENFYTGAVVESFSGLETRIRAVFDKYWSFGSSHCC